MQHLLAHFDSRVSIFSPRGEKAVKLFPASINGTQYWSSSHISA